MKWSTILIWLVGAGFAAYNASAILANTKPEGASFTADGVKFVCGPMAASGALVALWSLIKKFAPVIAGRLLKGKLDSYAAKNGILPDAPKAAESTNVDATRIALSEPNIELSIVLTGDAANDPIGRKKIGAVMEHYGSGGQAKS